MITERNMPLKVFFYHAGDLLSKTFFLSVTDLYLKTHLDISYPDVATQVEWLTPSQHIMSDDELVNFCNEADVDLLCTGHYIWNDSALKAQLARIKPLLNPKILIVSGGPQLDVNVDSEFFNKYPFIDYAIYGPGEVAFSDLICSIINKKKLIAFNTSNIAWQDKITKKTVVADYKYVPQSKISPYLYNEEFFTKMVKKETDAGTRSIFLPYELTRGCPYSCTFCDWNSGFGNKVSRRKETYKEEIDLFQKLNITHIYLADANVGQYQEDVDMVAYFAEKNISENAGFILTANFSKLKLENNIKIFHLMIKGKLFNNEWGFPIAVQDIHEHVLANIDRPDIGWDQHKKVIKELHETYPELPIRIQIIFGLPGQTPKTCRETLRELAKYEVILMPYVSELLFASPAATNKEYQEKFKFKYSESLRYSNYSNNFFRGKFPEYCYSFSQEDLVEMVILTSFYHALLMLKFEIRNFNSVPYDIETTVDYFLASPEYFRLRNNLLDNWKNDKFYYTIDFDGSEKIISADMMEITSTVWLENKYFIYWLHRINPNSNIVNSWAKSDRSGFIL